jgi:methionyl-tRNA formyltransferase
MIESKKHKIMKIAFFGTPEIAVETLKTLNQITSIKIECVVTQPDKPVGRKHMLTPPPIKKAAIEMNLKIIQPKSKLDIYEKLKDLKVDFFVVFAYGMILEEKVLEIPKYASINIHTSLLPKYRGASPIQEALINGDKETGITIIKMDKEMDHGPIYIVKKTPIEEKDNAETLGKKLGDTSAKIVPLILEDIASGTLTPIKQDHEKASCCRKISREDGKINWNKSAKSINNLIKAYTPWPSTYTLKKDKKIKIIEAEIEKSNREKTPGTFFTENGILKVSTKDGNLILKKLQLEGKKEMDAKSFLNGYKALIQ